MAEQQQRSSLITDKSLADLRKLVGVPIEDSLEPWCYEATRDNIRHWAHDDLTGIGVQARARGSHRCSPPTQVNFRTMHRISIFSRISVIIPANVSNCYYDGRLISRATI